MKLGIRFLSRVAFVMVAASVGRRSAFAAGGGLEAQVTVVGDQAPSVRIFSNDLTLRKTMTLFSDRGFKVEADLPHQLLGQLYYELSFDRAHSYRCENPGSLFALTPSDPRPNKARAMEQAGFARIVSLAPFPLYGADSAANFALYSKSLKAGEVVNLPAGVVVAGFRLARPMPSGEMLYNGIRLPQEWPPRIDWNTDEPMPVPYLETPPKLISIDVGRQLFVDEFLVQSTTLTREFHYPEKYEGNPILKPETAIEKQGSNNLAVAGPKSGGLWWNPEKNLFELWYEAGWVTTIAYATSKDGLHWDRPNLPLRPGTNQVLPSAIKPDSWTVVRDYRSTDPQEDYKIFLRGGGTRDRARYFTSADGLDWGPAGLGGITGDRSTMFYNAFRKKWVYSLRWDSPGGRSRAYWEADDFRTGMQWLPGEPRPWARADRLDPADPAVGDKPQLYNLDAVPYESLMLGFFEILHGPSNDVNAVKGLPKYTGLNFAYSRDGFHWSRPDRHMALDSEKRPVWDRGYVQSLGNICTVRGDKLWFYYIGFAGDEKVRLGEHGITSSMKSGMYANAATGVAFLRRDGFVSLNAGASPQTLLTRPVTFSGKYLYANVDAPDGALSAEVVDLRGQVIEPFSFANCEPISGDHTLASIHWRGGSDLTRLTNRAVRFRFKLARGKFYSFWVSRDETGRSDGFVAGGGPGFTSDVDTVGSAALGAEMQLRKTTGAVLK